MSELDEEIVTKAFKTTRSLTGSAAYSLLAVAPEIGYELNVSGVFAIASNNGMLIGLLAVGDKGTATNVRVVLAKLKTVIATQRSSSLQKARMNERKQDRSDFGGALGSLFGGGVALFANPGGIEFVGAMAFSGGTEAEDEKFCVTAKNRSGLTLWTDF